MDVMQNGKNSGGSIVERFFFVDYDKALSRADSLSDDEFFSIREVIAALERTDRNFLTSLQLTTLTSQVQAHLENLTDLLGILANLNDDIPF